MFYSPKILIQNENLNNSLNFAILILRKFLKMYEQFQQNIQDYFDKLTTEKFVNGNILRSTSDTDWLIIVSLTVCSVKDKLFKDFLHERDYLQESIASGYLENFERFNDPLITGLFYYYKFQISRQMSKLNQIKNNIKNQSEKSLRNKLISLAKSFNCYKRSFNPKQALCNGVSDILSTFTPNSLFNLQEKINTLKANLNDTFVFTEFQLNDFKLKDYETNIKKTFNFMYKMCNSNRYGSNINPKITLPDDFKNEINDMIINLDATINEIPPLFTQLTLPHIVKIDFFLQCSWLVSLVYSTIAHPPVQTFKEAYLPDERTLPEGSFSKLPLDNEIRMVKIIDQMGRKRQLEFENATEILDTWRSELNKFDERYKKLYFAKQENKNIIDIIESKQLSEDEDSDAELQEITFIFPDEFSAFKETLENGGMKKIKEIIDKKIIGYFKKLTEENECFNLEEEEEDEAELEEEEEEEEYKGEKDE